MTSPSNESGLSVLLNDKCRLLPSMATSSADLESCAHTEASVSFFTLQLMAAIVFVVLFVHNWPRAGDASSASFYWTLLALALWALASVGLWFGMHALGGWIGKRRWAAVQTAIANLMKTGRTEQQARDILSQQEIMGGLQSAMMSAGRGGGGVATFGAGAVVGASVAR